MRDFAEIASLLAPTDAREQSGKARRVVVDDAVDDRVPRSPGGRKIRLRADDHFRNPCTIAGLSGYVAIHRDTDWQLVG